MLLIFIGFTFTDVPPLLLPPDASAESLSADAPLLFPFLLDIIPFFLYSIENEGNLEVSVATDRMVIVKERTNERIASVQR